VRARPDEHYAILNSKSLGGNEHAVGLDVQSRHQTLLEKKPALAARLRPVHLSKEPRVGLIWPVFSDTAGGGRTADGLCRACSGVAGSARAKLMWR